MVSIHLRGGESFLVFCFRGLSRLVYHLYVVWLLASSLMNFWFTYKKNNNNLVNVLKWSSFPLLILYKFVFSMFMGLVFRFHGFCQHSQLGLSATRFT